MRRLGGSGAAFDRRYFSFLENARRRLPPSATAVLSESPRKSRTSTSPRISCSARGRVHGPDGLEPGSPRRFGHRGLRPAAPPRRSTRSRSCRRGFSCPGLRHDAFPLALARVAGVVAAAGAVGWVVARALLPPDRPFRLERLGWAFAVGVGLLESFVPLSFRGRETGWICFAPRGGRPRARLRLPRGGPRVSAPARGGGPPVAVRAALGLLIVVGVALYALRALTEPMWSKDFVVRSGAQGKAIFLAGGMPERRPGSPASPIRVPAGASVPLRGVRVLTRGWDDHAMRSSSALSDRHALRRGGMAAAPRRHAGHRPARRRDLASFGAAPLGFLAGLAEVPLAFGALLFGTASRTRSSRRRRERSGGWPSPRRSWRPQRTKASSRGRGMRAGPSQSAGAAAGASPPRRCRPRSSCTPCISCGAAGPLRDFDLGLFRSGGSARPSGRPRASSVRRGGRARSWWRRSSSSVSGGRTPPYYWRSRPRLAAYVRSPRSRYAGRSGWPARRCFARARLWPRSSPRPSRSASRRRVAPDRAPPTGVYARAINQGRTT